MLTACRSGASVPPAAWSQLSGAVWSPVAEGRTCGKCRALVTVTPRRAWATGTWTRNMDDEVPSPHRRGVRPADSGVPAVPRRAFLGTQSLAVSARWQCPAAASGPLRPTAPGIPSCSQQQALSCFCVPGSVLSAGQGSLGEPSWDHAVCSGVTPRVDRDVGRTGYCRGSRQ